MALSESDQSKMAQKQNSQNRKVQNRGGGAGPGFGHLTKSKDSSPRPCQGQAVLPPRLVPMCPYARVAPVSNTVLNTAVQDCPAHDTKPGHKHNQTLFILYWQSWKLVLGETLGEKCHLGMMMEDPTTSWKETGSAAKQLENHFNWHEVLIHKTL